jgi:hypothetical protein
MMRAEPFEGNDMGLIVGIKFVLWAAAVIAALVIGLTSGRARPGSPRDSGGAASGSLVLIAWIAIAGYALLAGLGFLPTPLALAYPHAVRAVMLAVGILMLVVLLLSYLGRAAEQPKRQWGVASRPRE